MSMFLLVGEKIVVTAKESLIGFFVACILEVIYQVVWFVDSIQVIS